MIGKLYAEHTVQAQGLVCTAKNCWSITLYAGEFTRRSALRLEFFILRNFLALMLRQTHVFR